MFQRNSKLNLFLIDLTDEKTLAEIETNLKLEAKKREDASAFDHFITSEFEYFISPTATALKVEPTWPAVKNKMLELRKTAAYVLQDSVEPILHKLAISLAVEKKDYHPDEVKQLQNGTTPLGNFEISQLKTYFRMTVQSPMRELTQPSLPIEPVINKSIVKPASSIMDSLFSLLISLSKQKVETKDKQWDSENSVITETKKSLSSSLVVKKKGHTAQAISYTLPNNEVIKVDKATQEKLDEEYARHLHNSFFAENSLSREEQIANDEAIAKALEENPSYKLR
jgi:hypothetical protein